MDQQDKANRRHRLELLNAAAVLMDLCGLSVAEALAVRVRLTPEQLARLRAAASENVSLPSAKIAAHEILDEVRAAAARPAEPKKRRGRKPKSKQKSVKVA